MTIALPDFIAELTQNPALFITVLLTLGVILVNGWTDAPQRHCHLRLHQKHGGFVPRSLWRRFSTSLEFW